MAKKNIESVLHEERRFEPSAEFRARARVKPKDLEALQRKAAQDHVGFWADLAREQLTWHRPFSIAFDDHHAPNFRWFIDGDLNVAYNVLDVHLEERGHKTAIIFEGEPGDTRRLSYRELHSEVCRFANALRALGIHKGDRVVIYMPLVPEIVIAMLACARIGAVHSVVFGGFSAPSLRDRIEDAGARLVITADGGNRGGHVIPLKATTDKALAGGCPTIEKVIVYRRTGFEVPMQEGRDLWWHDVIAGQSPVCEPEFVNAEHPLFLLYTSGSTGKPKGIQHCSAGLPARGQGHVPVGVRPQRFGCFLVHCRRRLGHRPQLCGVRPAVEWRDRRHVRRRADHSRCRAVLEDLRNARRHRVLHGADRDPRADETRRGVPAPLRPEQAAPARQRRRADQPRSVDVVSAGDRQGPLPDRRHVVADGDGLHPDLADPRRHATKPGSCTRPLPGIVADIVDEEGNAVLEPDHGGFLVIRKPWPSMLRTIWGDNQRYISTYWERFQRRLYVAGDSAHRDADGYYWIMGRIDDVLNVAGHRLGTMEIESALVAHARVAEAAVVGRPHEIKGESVFAYVVCRGARPTGNTAAFERELRDWVGRAARRDREARRHPLRRQSSEDSLRQDHAPPAARDRARRGDHAGRFDARESRPSSISCAASTGRSRTRPASSSASPRLPSQRGSASVGRAAVPASARRKARSRRGVKSGKSQKPEEVSRARQVCCCIAAPAPGRTTFRFTQERRNSSGAHPAVSFAQQIDAA